MSKVVTGDVTCMFPHVFAPFAFESEEPKYSVRLLIPKTDKEQLTKLKKAVDDAIEEKGLQKFGKNFKKDMLRNPLRDGDAEMDNDGNPRHPGMIFINARSKTKPTVVDRRKNAIEDTEAIYSGCIVRVFLSAFCYATSGNKGIAFGLEALQKIKDGEMGAGNVNVFDDLGEDPSTDEALPF